jgi:hypothetical protein
VRNHHKRLLAYLGATILVVGGGVLVQQKYIDASAGLALITAGGYVFGALQKEALPRPHNRRKEDPPVVEKEMT